MRHTRTWLVAIAAAALALAVRLPADERLAPFDELYHWKRIVSSVQHFPQVLEFDRERGIGGAFCPWPPLYDLSAAAVARLAGARGPDEILRIIRWIPPLLTAILAGLAAAIIARHSLFAGVIAAVPLAVGPFLVSASSAGDVDHHFLEPFLVLAIAGATVLVVRARDRGSAVAAGVSLAAALIAALFVQTALIIAAALAFVCVFGRHRLACAAAAASFASAAVVVAVYRVTRLPGFPDGPWFLGWTHAALLAGAALALMLARRSAAVALATGALLALAVPGVADAMLGGVRFFGGDMWLETIDEFAPVWRPLSRLPNYIAGVGAGAVASLLLVRRSPAAAVVAVFTLTYIAATLPSRRFATVATVLAAVAGAMAVDALRRDGRRRSAGVLAMVVVIVPTLQLIAWSVTSPAPRPALARFEAVARELRDLPEDGGVLAPWSYGHMFDVMGGRPVIVDNFGTMPDAEVFRQAHAVVLSRSEEDVAAFCDRARVRYVVLGAPQGGIPTHVRLLALPMESYFRDGSATAHTRATWYWRAWRADPALRHFRRIMTRDGVVVLERDYGISFEAKLRGASDGT